MIRTEKDACGTFHEMNFRKTFQLIETCKALKMAYLKTKNPPAPDMEIRDLFYDDMLQRKERQWKAIISSLTSENSPRP